jgi:Carboxypeptidase regulatory-like domain
MRKCIRLVAALLWVAALTLWAAPPMTKLTVEVKSLEGKPIDRASVIVKFVEGRSVAKLGKKIRTTYELRTDQDGQARIPSIPQGKIQVQVIAKNYQTFGKVFDVDQEEKTLEIQLNPPQAQFSAHQ